MASKSSLETYPVEPDSFPYKGTSGSGGLVAYSVEARYAYPEPKIFAGNLLDSRWRTVHFDKVQPPFGVPAGGRYHQPMLYYTGLYEYQAAQALRWWFLAAAHAEFSCGCIETRLIEHKIEYSFKSTATKAVAPVGGDDRSSIMPDWGKTEPPPLPKEAAE